MAVENLKSLSITNLDAQPVVANTAGEGGPGYLWNTNDFVIPSAASTAASTYRMCRVPSNAIIKAVWFESQAQGAGTFDISVYYTDSPYEGQAPGGSGVVVPTTGSQFFANAIAVTAAVASTNEINQSGNNPPNLRNTELWSALGLTTDPGGFFDIVVVTNVALTTGTGQVGVRVEYVW